MARFHPSLWNATDFGPSMPKRDKPWWSLDHGPLHVIMLSSEHDVSNHSEQHGS